MNIVDKYLTEASIKIKKADIKNLIQRGKSGKYDIEGNTVLLKVVDSTIIIEYSESMMNLTYQLIQVSDDLGFDYQQIGLGKKKNIKFIIDVS